MVNTENRAKTALGIPLRWADLIIDATFSDEKSGKAVLNAHSVVPIQLGPTGPQVPLEIIENDRCQCRRERRVWPVAPTSGIGTTSPAAALDVNGGIVQRSAAAYNFSGYMNTNASNVQSTTGLLNPGILLYNNGINYWGMDLGYSPTAARYRTRLFATGGDLTLSAVSASGTSQSNFTDLLVVRGDTGNVGIGTTSPGQRLHVYGDSSSTATGNPWLGTMDFIDNADTVNGTMAGYLTSTHDTGGTQITVGGVYSSITNHTPGSVAGDLLFATNPGGVTLPERMRITAAGNVGIGTTAPGSQLAVGNASTGTSTFQLADAVFSKTPGSVLTSNTGVNFTSVVEVLNGGTAGWGGTYGSLMMYQGDLPGYPGNSYPIIKTDATNFGFSVGGSFSSYISTNGTYSSVSDRNRKENFVVLDPEDILAKIDAMPMMEWNFKGEDPEVKHIGPIAQDFHEAFHLNGPDDKKISHIDPAGVAIVGVKGLSKRTAELQAENEQLKADSAQQTAEIARLKADAAQMKSFVCQQFPQAPLCAQ